MAALKVHQIFAIFAICAIVSIVDADLTFSIRTSRVPNLQYEVDAIDCLQEAYVLYPDNTNSRNDAVSKLYQNKHSTSGGWNIADGCKSSYNPGATIFVEVNVKNDVDGSVTAIKIFN